MDRRSPDTRSAQVAAYVDRDALVIYRPPAEICCTSKHLRHSESLNVACGGALLEKRGPLMIERSKPPMKETTFFIGCRLIRRRPNPCVAAGVPAQGDEEQNR
jgi:hypothetical protein